MKIVRWREREKVTNRRKKEQRYRKKREMAIGNRRERKTERKREKNLILNIIFYNGCMVSNAIISTLRKRKFTGNKRDIEKETENGR